MAETDYDTAARISRSNPETIIAAAILDQDGKVHSLPRPARHGDIFRANPDLYKAEKEQGFVTSTGQFVGRWKAMRIAARAMQVPHNLLRRADGELFSEDLW